MTQDVSFIIPSLNEGENLCKTIQSLQATADCHYEIIVVDNGSTDGSSDFIQRPKGDSRVRLFKIDRPLGVAGARNFGADRAQGDIMIFADAHIFFPQGWLNPILSALSQEGVGIVAPGINVWGNPSVKGFGMRWRNARMDVEWLGQQSAEPYTVPMVPGGCMAFRRDFFQEIGRFDSGMVNYGSEDLEICLRAWLLGYEVVIAPHVEVSHVFRSRHPYDVNWQHVVHNMLRTVYAHFNTRRAARAIAAIRSLPSFETAFSLLQASDIWERRRTLEQQRKRDDDWFFTRFNINI